jgi:2-polyprenyl-3-methyl-5-hydroxy-6-metoxy-1,4-benzoquinol methylase
MTAPRPDRNSISKYYQTNTYISHRDNPKNIIDSIYLRARQYALNWKISKIREINNNAETIFDYGCGTGEFVRYCISKGYKAFGYEPSPDARMLAIEKSPQAIVNQVDELKTPLDIVTLWHVLEHVHDLRETVNMLASKLKPQGTMLIAVPNHKSSDAMRYQSYWAGYDTPRHLWHFDQNSMSRLLKTSNLKLVGTIPMKLDAYYIS